MEKTTDLPQKSLLQKAVVSTVCQYLFFKVIFAGYLQIYIVSHSYRATVWSAVILYFAIPVLGGCGYCWLRNRRTFGFRPGQMREPLAVQRLSVRVLTVACFLVCGYVLERMRAGDPELPVRWFAATGLSDDFVFHLVFSFPLYLVTALFPVSYAVAEWLCQPAAQECNQ